MSLTSGFTHESTIQNGWVFIVAQTFAWKRLMDDDYIDAFRDTRSPQKFVPCSQCGRTFNPDSLSRHEKICQTIKKRKPFDTSRKRLQAIASEAGVSVHELTKSSKQEFSRTPIRPKKQSWRAQHEEFISTIRAARGVTAAQRTGAELPPPPPPAVNPDYVQCPHCLRRFNQYAAERHMPFCKEQKSRISRAPPSNNASTSLAKRTQYRPSLPNKRATSGSSSAGSSARSRQLDYRAENYQALPKALGGGSLEKITTPSPKSHRRTQHSDVNNNHKLRRIQKTSSPPILSRRRLSQEFNGSNFGRTHSKEHLTNYLDSDDDTLKTEVKYGRRAMGNPHTVINGDSEKGYRPSRPDRFDSDSDFSSRESSASSSAGKTRRRHVAIREADTNLMEDFITKRTPTPPNRTAPFPSRSQAIHKEPSDTAPSERQGSGKRLSKFCYECGTKYPALNAKYCCECGMKRLYIES